MANTFLNTGRTVSMATSNPQANVEQVNSQSTVQPVQNNVNSPVVQNQSQGQINPITIPIQIQPQIAQTGQPQTTSVQPGANLQTNNIQPNNAPTPQTYQGTNQNNNTVDFNQIYSAYNQAVGNANNNTNIMSSGIKKTSLGTTIVTPTSTNLNTVQGQYQSAYADTVNGLISEMLTQMKNGFSYAPTQDTALKLASEYAANSTLQSLAGSGVLNSSSTSERVARIVSELIPTYEEKAHDRWTEYLGQLASTAQIVMNYDSQQFEYWKDAKDRDFKEKEFEYQKQQDKLENAWKRVDELGYVDNEASIILGVAVGTLSGEARQAKEQREFELQKMREQAQIEYENDKALYQLKSQLDLENEKALYEYKSNIDFNNEKALYDYKSNLDTQKSKELAENEYILAQKYGSTKNSNSNYENYDEIIKNRFAQYDDVTKQYVVPDEQTYNQLGNYLDNLYASGTINSEEFNRLSAKYSTYSNNNSSSTSSYIKSGLNSSNVSTWVKALDGNNDSLDSLGVNIWGQKKSNVNNSDAKKAVNEALKQINNGDYIFTSNQQLMNDLKNGYFGKLRWGF